MTNVSIALLSAAEFELARRFIGELSAYQSYDDWVDWRYGAFMGLSISGQDAQFVTVGLGPFLEWCDDRSLRPSESNLDAYALHLADGENFVQVVESSELDLPRPAALTQRKSRSISPSLAANRASRSIGLDL